MPFVTEEKKRALRQAEQAASRGDDPRNTFKKDHLEWLFGDDPDELDRIVAIATEAREERVRRHQAIAEKDLLNAEIESVLAEQDREALAARRRAAEKIARERLGMEPA